MKVKTALLIFVIFIFSSALIIPPVSGVEIKVGKVRDWVGRWLAEQRGLPASEGERLLKEEEAKRGIQVIESFDLPEGSLIDFYQLDGGQQLGDLPGLNFQGCARMISPYTPEGKEFWEAVERTKGTPAYDYFQSLLKQALERGFFVQKVDMKQALGQGPLRQPTVYRALAVAVQFPGFHDVNPQPNPPGDCTQTNPGPAGIGGRFGGTPPTRQGLNSWDQTHPQITFQTYNSAQLQDRWWDLLFNTNNPNSVTNYYYQSSHGRVSLQGTPSDVVGWLQTRYYLDVRPGGPGQGGPINYIQPGTPDEGGPGSGWRDGCFDWGTTRTPFRDGAGGDHPWPVQSWQYHRMKPYCYYTHDHDFHPASDPYQLAFIRDSNHNIVAWNDPNGTNDEEQDRRDRPAPLDHDAEDDANHPNSGIFGSGTHSVAGLISDVLAVLQDYGKDITPYQRIIIIVPAGGSAPTGAHAFMACAAGSFIVVPETAGLATVAHELGHTFGLQDLYDTDFYYNAAGNQPPHFISNMMGPYSVMAAGIRMDPFSKILAGWLTPEEVTTDRLNAQLPAIEGTLEKPVVLKVTNPFEPQEYWLIENHNQQLFGDYTPMGTYIYHIDLRARKPDPTGWGESDENFPLCMVEQADGLRELEKNPAGNPGNLEGDPFPGSTNNRNFTQLTNPNSHSHGNVDPVTGHLEPGTEYDTYIRVADISDPGAVTRMNIFVAPRELQVSGTDLVPLADVDPVTPGYQIRQGATNVPMEMLTFTHTGVSTNDVKIIAIRIDESGESKVDTDVARVRLFDDTNVGGGSVGVFDPLYDTLLAQGQFSNQSVTLSGFSVVVPFGGQKRFFIVYDISPTAITSPARTVGARLEYNTYVTPEIPGAIAKTNFPIASSNLQIIEAPDTLTVMPISKAPSTAAQGTKNVVMAQLQLSVNMDSVMVRKIKIEESGSSTKDTDVAKVKLYDDANNNGALDAGEALVGEAGISGQVAILDNLGYQVVAGTPRSLLITYDIFDDATVGATVGVKILNSTYVTLEDPVDQVSEVNLPFTSDNALIIKTPHTLTVSGVDLAPGYVDPGQADVLMEKLILSAGVGSITVNSIKIEESGTGTGATDITRVDLYEDTNDDNQITGEPLLGSGTFTALDEATISLTDFTVAAGSARRILVVYQISPDAVVGHTLAVRLSGPGNLDVDGDNVSPINFPIESTKSTVRGTVTVAATGYAPTSVLQGATDVSMLGLSLTAGPANIVIDSIRVDEGGSSLVDTDVSAVKLYDDPNNNGLVDPGETLLQQGVFSGQTCEFKGLGYAIAKNTTRYMLIVYDISKAASIGKTVNALITDNSYIRGPGVVVFGAFPFQSQNSTILDAPDDLTVTGTSLAPRFVGYGQLNVAMEKLTLTLETDFTTITAVKIDEIGTCNGDADISSVKLYEDVNNNNAVDGSDRLLGQGNFAGESVTINILGGFPMNAGETKYFLVVYDIGNTADPGETAGVRLADISYISAAPDNVIFPISPIESDTSIITQDVLVVSGTSLAPSDVQQGQTDVVMEKLNLSTTSPGSIQVNSIRISETGTCNGDADITAAKLYDDANGNDIPEPGELLDTKTFSGETATFAPLSITVTAAAPKVLLIAYDFSITAGIGTTAGVGLTATDIQLAPRDVVDPMNFPISSALTTIKDGPDTLVVAPVDLAPSQVMQGDTVAMAKLVLTVVDQDWVILNSVRVDQTGTATGQTDVQKVKLYEDTNGNDQFDGEPMDTLLKEGAFVGQSCNLTQLNYQVTVGTFKTLFVVYRIADLASIGKTLTVNLTNSGFVVSAPDIVQPFSFTSTASEIVGKPDTLQVSGVSLAPSEAFTVQTGVVMEKLILTVPTGGSVIVTSVKIDESGTSTTDSDVAAAKLYEDTNNDNQPDVLLKSTTISNQSALFDGLNYEVTGTKYLLVVYDINPAAAAGKTLGVRLANNGYITVAVPDIVDPANFPIQSEETLLKVNRAPTLSADPATAVSPLYGKGGTTFTYTATYADADGTAPTYVRLVIDDVERFEVPTTTPPAPKPSDWVAGVVYKWMITGLIEGSHNFHFEGSDGFVTARWPTTGEQPGPTVDDTPPRLIRAKALSGTAVEALFDEEVKKATAEILTNYSISAGAQTLEVKGVVLQPDNKTVKLTTEPQRAGVTYTLVVQGVEDLAGNVIGANNTATFLGVETIPPQVTSASAVDSTHVDVVFNEFVKKSTAEVKENYTIQNLTQTQPLTITQATLQSDNKIVRLTTSSEMLDYNRYKVTVTAVQDLAGNEVDPNKNWAEFIMPFKVTKLKGLHLIAISGVPNLPIPADSEDPAKVLGLDPYTIKWARWNPEDASYHFYYGDKYAWFVPPSETPGKGYWLKLEADKVFIIRADPVTATSYPIGLKAGWNMIGNPYTSSVEWDPAILQVQPTVGAPMPLAEAGELVESYAWGWTGTEWFLVSKALLGKFPKVIVLSQMEGWQGYWIKAKQDCKLIIPKPTKEIETRLAEKSETRRLQGKGWQVQLIATAGDKRDSCNFLGVSEEPEGTQIANPPRVYGEYVDIYFLGKENERLALDLRTATASSGSGKISWRFAVETNLPNADIHISWPELSSVPKSLSLRLIDETSGRAIYMRTTAGYSFRSGSEETRRTFQVEVEPAYSASPLRIVNLTATTLRGRGEAAISYSLSEAAQVEVKIYTLSGRLVRVLSLGRTSSSGLNTLIWDLRDSSSQPVPNGPYLCEVVARTEEGRSAKASRTILVVK